MSPLNYDRILEEPVPVYMGPLPVCYADIPAKVVINMCGEYPTGEASGHMTLAMPLFDVQETKFLPDRGEFERFLQEVHKYAADQPSYWHCHAGINRSGLALAAYLAIYRELKISEAIQLLRRRRSPLVLCNSLFERTLRKWYGGPDEQRFEPFSVEAYLAGRLGAIV
jgi:protein-tyrosine phosphatase